MQCTYNLQVRLLLWLKNLWLRDLFIHTWHFLVSFSPSVCLPWIHPVALQTQANFQGPQTSFSSSEEVCIIRDCEGLLGNFLLLAFRQKGTDPSNFSFCPSLWNWPCISHLCQSANCWSMRRPLPQYSCKVPSRDFGEDFYQKPLENLSHTKPDHLSTGC